MLGVVGQQCCVRLHAALGPVHTNRDIFETAYFFFFTWIRVYGASDHSAVWAKTYVRLSATGKTLVRTCKPPT